MARPPWFEDFNDHAPRPAAVAEDPPSPPGDLPDPRMEGWTEGFLAGCRAGSAGAAGQARDVAAELTQRVAAIEDSLNAIANQSAATMGGLLLDILAAVLPPAAPADRLEEAAPADRLEEIVAAIRPIFALEPRLHVSPAVPGEVSFRDLPAFYRAMEAGDWELALRWHQPGGDIDPAGMAASIRRAIAPAGAKSVPLAADEG
nr:hypothetical protein [uncultured Rhodopila sp.]